MMFTAGALPAGYLAKPAIDEISPLTASLIAVARLGTRANGTRPSFDAVMRWYKGLPPDVKDFFASAVSNLSIRFDEAVDVNLRELPDLTATAEFLSRQLLRQQPAAAGKKRGAVFTPTWLARRVTKSAMRHWRRLHRKGNPPQRVADLSCGPGVFLQCIQAELDQRSEIFGVDVDRQSCMYT